MDARVASHPGPELPDNGPLCRFRHGGIVGRSRDCRRGCEQFDHLARKWNDVFIRCCVCRTGGTSDWSGQQHGCATYRPAGVAGRCRILGSRNNPYAQYRENTAGLDRS